MAHTLVEIVESVWAFQQVKEGCLSSLGKNSNSKSYYRLNQYSEASLWSLNLSSFAQASAEKWPIIIQRAERADSLWQEAWVRSSI